MPQAMQGIRILDFSMGVAGPHAAMLCAQHGADVVKVETHEGDWVRVLGQQYGDLSAFSIVYNRGKRSLAINMKDPVALAAVRDMALQADVVIEAFRPGVMKKFGLDYASLSALRPNLVYMSVNGFGSEGPLVDAPATDAILQAYSGLMYSNQDAEGNPQRIDLVLIDVLTGLYGFQAVSAALLEQARFGTPGRYIECSLMKSAIAFQSGKIVENFIEKGDRALYVPLGAFATSDGHISLSVRRDDHFATLCQALGRGDLVACGRYATGAQRVERQAELLPLLRAEFGRLTTDALCAVLTGVGILHSRINTYAEMLGHEQTAAGQAVHWQMQDGISQLLPIAEIPGAPNLSADIQAPHIGEHSLEVLRDWGVGEDVIGVMLGSGAVRREAGRPLGAVPR